MWFIFMACLSGAAAIALTVGITQLVIRYAPKGWRTKISAAWFAAPPVILNMLDVVKDVDWTLFVERRGFAAGIGIGVSWSIILLKQATMKAVAEDRAADAGDPS